MHRIVHLSDLHIGAQQEDEEDHLQRIVEGLLDAFAAEADRTLVLITGDLVEDGQGDQILDGLDTRPNTHKVLLHLHHHPFHYSDEDILECTYEWIGHRLKDGAAFMDVIAGRVDALLFGHEHRHLDFSGTALSQRFRIPVILSAGKCTRVSKEYKVTEDGAIDKTEILHEGRLCRVIEVSTDGNMNARTVAF